MNLNGLIHFKEIQLINTSFHQRDTPTGKDVDELNLQSLKYPILPNKSVHITKYCFEILVPSVYIISLVRGELTGEMRVMAWLLTRLAYFPCRVQRGDRDYQRPPEENPP